MVESAIGAFNAASGPRLVSWSWSCPSVVRSSVSWTDAVVCGICVRWRFPVQLFLWWNICHPAWMGSEHWRHIVVCDADRFMILPTTRYEQGRNEVTFKSNFLIKLKVTFKSVYLIKLKVTFNVTFNFFKSYFWMYLLITLKVTFKCVYLIILEVTFNVSFNFIQSYFWMYLLIKLKLLFKVTFL